MRHLTPEIVEAVDAMQKSCVQAYLAVAAALQVGMTEAAIARAVRGDLESNGVRDFWYDIPIVMLVGIGRFEDMNAADYALKSPSEAVGLAAGSPFYIDIHCRHESGQWGNFAATGIYRPAHDEAVNFLTQMQQIEEAGIRRLSGDQTGGEVARWFSQQFEQAGIEHQDVRANFGHSMGSGAKRAYQRYFLDESNTTPIGGEIFGIEPGGVQRDSSGKVAAVARFEDCVYIPRDGGQAIILGRQQPMPVTFS